MALEPTESGLRWDGVLLEEAASRFGTPLYLYSAATMLDAFAAYERAFAGLPHRICYALKANASGALLRLLAARGAGADIVSGMELLAALRAGFPPERIVFAGVGKSEAELEQAVSTGVGHVNAESEDEIERLAAVGTRVGRAIRVSLRVNPDIDARSHPYISTGLKENKFGVDIAAAPDILRRARGRSGVVVVGLQCHIGSQILDLRPLGDAARALADLSRFLLAEGFPLETLDIGGGLGVDYDGQGAPGLAEFAAAIRPALEGLPLTLLLEPGRSLVAAAGVLLTRVLYLKRNGDKRFVIVDAGMNDLLRPALYQAHHRIEPVMPRPGAAFVADIVGPVCESGDFLARGREVLPLEPGDLLAVRDVGAYGFVMASNYNLRPRAAEALIEDGAVRLIRRRETFDDLVRNEMP
jgi:diaminopimelate decarboxylase